MQSETTLNYITLMKEIVASGLSGEAAVAEWHKRLTPAMRREMLRDNMEFAMKRGLAPDLLAALDKGDPDRLAELFNIAMRC